MFLQFAPTYHDYVLYNGNESEEYTTKYRSRTFVPTGQEMDAVRKNRDFISNKNDDVQLFSVSSSSGASSPKRATAATSILVMDATNLPSEAYDLSLIDMDLSAIDNKVPAVVSNSSATR